MAAGKPDFLLHRGGSVYEAADAKLSNSLDDKNEILIQMVVYKKLLDSPPPGQVYLGDGSVEPVSDVAGAKADQFISDMRSLISFSEPPEAPYSHSKCTTIL